MTITAGDRVESIIAGGSIGWEAYGYGEDGNPTMEELLNPNGELTMPVSFLTVRSQRSSIGDFRAYSGNIDVYATAYDSIGYMMAHKDLYGILNAETGNLGFLLAETGDLDIQATAGNNIGEVSAPTGSILGTTELTAGNSIDAVSALLNIGGAYTTETGNIWGFHADLGDVEICATSGDTMGIIEAPVGSVNATVTVAHEFMDTVAVGGILYAEIGSIFANVTSGGNVGAFESTFPGGTDETVVGGIAAPIGTISVGLRVGGHVGGVSATQVDLHGVDGGDAIIVGTIGILRNVLPGSQGAVHGINALNSFILTSDDIDYMVAVTDGTAAVWHSVGLDGAVVFNTVSYDPGLADTNSLTVTTSYKDDDVPVLVLVDELLSSGSVDTIDVEGDVTAAQVDGYLNEMNVEGDFWSLDVAGNLTDLTVGGDLGDLTVGSLSGIPADRGMVDVGGIIRGIMSYGDIVNEIIRAGSSAAPDVVNGQYAIGSIYAVGGIGTAAGTVDPFKPDDVDILATSFGSVDAGGTNYGLVRASLGKSEWISWANQRTGDGYITAYLQSGEADLSVNFGFLEEVTFQSNSKNFVVLTDDVAYDDASDTTPTVKDNLNKATDKLLKSQTKLIAKGVASSGHGSNVVANLVLENGRTSIPGTDTVQIGRINLPTTSGKSMKVNKLVVEGSVREIGTVGVRAGSVQDAQIVGDVGAVRLTGDLKKANVGGSVGAIFADKVQNLTVDGAIGSMTATDVNTLLVDGVIERMSAAKNIKDVFAGGGAGVLSAGNDIKGLQVHGGVLDISGKKLSDVSITGGIGLVLDADGNIVFNPSGISDVDAVLGGSAADYGDAGPVAGNLYIGGLEADSVKKVAVAGDVVDVTIHDKASSLGLDAIVQAIDDAFVRLSSKTVLIKEDGVLVNWDQLDATPDSRQ